MESGAGVADDCNGGDYAVAESAGGRKQFLGGRAE